MTQNPKEKSILPLEPQQGETIIKRAIKAALVLSFLAFTFSYVERKFMAVQLPDECFDTSLELKFVENVVLTNEVMMWSMVAFIVFLVLWIFAT